MKIILYALAAFVLLVVYVRFLENVSLFYPSRKINATPADAGLQYEDVYFSTQDHVRLNGWFVKAGSHQAATILFCHGNAGSIGDRVEKIEVFHNLGLNVFIFDYRGFGRSQGFHPTEQGMYKDALAAYDYLVKRTDIDKNKIVLYGASMGGVAAIDLLTKQKVAALILDSTFTNAADMAKKIAPFIPSFILTVKLDNLTKIKSITIPKLFIHSPGDRTVPFRLGKKLFAAAPEPKEFLQISGDHNEGYALSESIFLPGIKKFLEQNGLQ